MVFVLIDFYVFKVKESETIGKNLVYMFKYSIGLRVPGIAFLFLQAHIRA